MTIRQIVLRTLVALGAAVLLTWCSVPVAPLVFRITSELSRT